MKEHVIGVFIGIIVVVAIFLGLSALSGLIIMFLWNVVSPAFDGPQLTFLQGWAVSILIGVFTKTITRRGGKSE